MQMHKSTVYIASKLDLTVQELQIHVIFPRKNNKWSDGYSDV
jgi:hypothetical protein